LHAAFHGIDFFLQMKEKIDAKSLKDFGKFKK